MPEKRLALIIANWDYKVDTKLHKLAAPPQDAKLLDQVLQNPDIGGFETKTLLNETSQVVSEQIETFFAECQKDDLALMYFSGHGVKDADGQLYFATSNTNLSRLRSTAVKAFDVNEMMRHSEARRQVLILDCCYSGAFAKGVIFKGIQSVETQDYFGGRGRAVLTAN